MSAKNEPGRLDSALCEGLGPLPEPAFGWLSVSVNDGRWTESATGERAFDAEQMRAYADAAVAAERERPRQVLAYMAANREGEVRFTDNPNAARELEGYGWAITPLADAGPNVRGNRETTR